MCLSLSQAGACIPLFVVLMFPQLAWPEAPKTDRGTFVFSFRLLPRTQAHNFSAVAGFPSCEERLDPPKWHLFKWPGFQSLTLSPTSCVTWANHSSSLGTAPPFLNTHGKRKGICGHLPHTQQPMGSPLLVRKREPRQGRPPGADLETFEGHDFHL